MNLFDLLSGGGGGAGKPATQEVVLLEEYPLAITCRFHRANELVCCHKT